MADFIDQVRKKAQSLLSGGDAAETGAADPAPAESRPGADEDLRQRLIEALRTIYDPEIPVNIYDLGLIYTIDVNAAEGTADVEMTLTAPACPVAQTFPATVEARLSEVAGIEEVTVKLVWDPPWTQDRMSEAARLELGLF